LNELHNNFTEDFLRSPFIFLGKPIAIDFTLEEGREKTFWHVITRDITKTGNREAELQRAVRVHWIGPILENYAHPNVTYFRYPEGSGRLRYYFWLRSDNYLVILEETARRFFLVTAYVVDKKHMINDIERKYSQRLKED
jgi:hypothetical protein